jgi:hypothetical protein
MFALEKERDYKGEDGQVCVKCGVYKKKAKFEKAVGGEIKRRCLSCAYHAQKVINCLKEENPPPGPDHKCDICKRTLDEIGTPDRPMLYRWILDHCHETDTFRGYICHNCNTGLGAFKDNVVVIKNAADYLERHRDENSS